MSIRAEAGRRKPDLSAFARQIRRDVIRMVVAAGSGHIGGAMSAAEIFAVLYGLPFLRGLIPDGEAGDASDPHRDRFVLSNGHICAAWYSALSLCGLLERSELNTHRIFGSRLQGHPSRHMLKEHVETSSGPLGQGFSVATGIALGKKRRGQGGNVFCLLGDGELQEGIVWESALTASHHGLDNLVAIVIDNDVQIDGRTRDVKNVRPIDAKFSAFGWRTQTVDDGHDLGALAAALTTARERHGQPTCIVANTVMAKGVQFMEGDPAWHGTAPTEDQAIRALNEIGHAELLEDF
jgi:transketolase